MLKLYVIRHGKAVKSTASGKDFNRELNNKGTAQINQTGTILNQQHVKFDKVISSSARRTVETTEILNFHLHSETFQYEDNLYLADRETILSILKENAIGKTILLVGHNYGLSDLVNYLVGNNLILSTGMLVEINFNFEDWEKLGRETGTLINKIEPNVHSF